MEALHSAGSILNARRTWDGSGMPDEQAAPVDAASRGCRAPRISRASKPSKRRLALPGCRCGKAGAGGPFTEIGNRLPRRRRTKASRWRAILLRSAGEASGLVKISAAAAMPIMSGTGTVPERSLPCWLPPWIMGSICVCRLRLMCRAPMPCGPYILYPEMLAMSICVARSRISIAQGAWPHRSETKSCRTPADWRSSECPRWFRFRCLQPWSIQAELLN